jgi:hypothetical protein
VAVSQLLYVLPDGQLDPEAPNDCGESCITSLFATARGMTLSPGCVRQMLGGHTRTGLTDAVALSSVLGALEMKPKRGAGGDRLVLSNEVADGHWVIVLGNYAAPGVPHWVVLYDYGPMRAWFMDPWTGRLRSKLWSAFMNLYLESWVSVPDPVHRVTG